MRPADLLAWRLRMGLTQAQAAEALRMPRRTYEDHEQGRQRGANPREIPGHVALACAAVAAGLPEWTP